MTSTPAFDGPDDAARYGESVLTGQTTRLRGLRDADLPLLTAWWADPTIGALQSAAVRPQSEAAARELILGWSENRGAGTAVGFSIETRAEPVELIGHVALWGIRPRDQVGTFGIILGPEARGRGFGPDATRTIVRYAFLELGLHRVELQVWSFNTRAIAAYRRAGFVEEGRRRQAVWHAGHRYDEVLMAVLADEWTADPQ